MVSLLYAFSFAALLFSSVSAHGDVTSVSVNGKSFPVGNVGRARNQNPLHRTDGTKLICNTGAKTSTKSSVLANPGDSVTFDWRTWTDAHHPGYIETFLADCGDSCNGFSGTGKVWFKIHETGLLQRTGGQFGAGVWATDKLVKEQGKKLSVKLPAGLKKGNYILRQNIVAMHLTKQPEFYPNCVHLTVGGSGSGAPSASDLVSIPAYLQTNDAKKALDVNIFTKPATYTIAGPRPVVLSGGKAAAAPAQETPAPESDDDAVTDAPATKPEADDDLTECSDDPEAPEADVNPPASSCKTKKGKGSSSCPKQTKRSNETTEAVEEKRDFSDALTSGVKVARRSLGLKHYKRRLAEQH